jgi:hypothetical protein
LATRSEPQKRGWMSLETVVEAARVAVVVHAGDDLLGLLIGRDAVLQVDQDDQGSPDVLDDFAFARGEMRRDCSSLGRVGSSWAS